MRTTLFLVFVKLNIAFSRGKVSNVNTLYAFLRG